ncbi:MAG: DNA polymerase I [Myxococcota bacterium]
MTDLFPPGAKDVLWLVDLSNYVFRAYHALPPLKNSNGEPTGATLGTLNMLNRLIEDQQPAYMAVVMDSPGRGFRREIDPEYKANRAAAPPDIIHQIERTREIFTAYGVPIYIRDGYEADDLIATLTHQARAQDLRVVIASTDKDLMQLVEPGKVLCWDAMRNNVYGLPEVEKKFGVGPDKVRHVLSLIGDTSDNVPGVPGVGPKTAAKLILEHGDIETLLASIDSVKRPKLRKSLEDNQEAVKRAFELVGLREDSALEFELEALRYGTRVNVDRLRELFTELQFTRFLEMLDEVEDEVPPSDAPPTVETSLLVELDALRELAAAAHREKRLAVFAFGPETEAMRCRLVGLALAAERGKPCYLPLDHHYLGVPKQLSLEMVTEILGPALRDPTIRKVGHDLKFTQVVLERHGFEVNGAGGDSMIAAYLLDPEATTKLSIVAERDAFMQWKEFKEIAPAPKRGVPKPTVDTLDVEVVGRWAGSHAEAALRLDERQRNKLEKAQLDELYGELELPLSHILTEMEQYGVLVDPEPLAGFAVTMEKELQALETQAYEAAGKEFNLGSPKQLEAVLFDELGLKSSRKTKTGRSTDAEALEAIQEDHPLPKIILEHRAIAKLKNTYVDALPKLIHPDTGRIHTRWDQAQAATGRIASQHPNMQNIPIRTEHGRRIREAFVAPEGKVILSGDYSQIELRVLAHLSGDDKLVTAFRTGQDVHVRTAMEIFGKAEDEVTPTMRAQSKTVNFGVIYGMGPVALGKKLGIPRKEAKGFIDAYFERYAGVREFMDETLSEAKRSKVVRTLLGRRRILPDLSSSNHARRAYAERIAQNTPIQGTAADLLKLAMVKLKEPLVPGARMVLTVHDELVFEVPEDAVEEAAAKAKSIMESIFELNIPLVVDVGFGRHWGLAH